MPSGSIIHYCQLIVMDSTFVDVVALASCTFTVKLDVARVVGLPEITPVELFRVKPVGKEPTEIDQV